MVKEKRKTENNSKSNATKKASKVKAFVTDSFPNCLPPPPPPSPSHNKPLYT